MLPSVATPRQETGASTNRDDTLPRRTRRPGADRNGHPTRTPARKSFGHSVCPASVLPSDPPRHSEPSTYRRSAHPSRHSEKAKNRCRPTASDWKSQTPHWRTARQHMATNRARSLSFGSDRRRRGQILARCHPNRSGSDAVPPAWRAGFRLFGRWSNPLDPLRHALRQKVQEAR